MARNRLLALLIVVATAAFAIGVALEDSDAHDESPTAVAQEVAHLESEEGEAEGTEHAEAQEAQDESSEDEAVLGIDLGSTPLVVLAVLGSLALAAGVWLRPDLRALLLVVAGAMLAFAALDVREVFHQIDESNEGIAALAGVVALLHASVAALAFTADGAGARAT